MWFVLCLVLVSSAYGQTWCNKYYKSPDPAIPPGGNFPNPPSSSSPLLAFRCAPAIKPYLPEDATSSPPLTDPDFVSFIIDTPITYQAIANTTPISSTSGSLAVTVSVANLGTVLAKGNVALNSTQHILPFSLSSLQPSSTPYNIACSAAASDGTTYNASALLYYLPDPPSEIGSVTKMDLRTGALWAKPANGSAGPYAPVIPVGFYTNFGGYLDADPTIPAKLKSQGFNVIHPIPPFDNQTALDGVLDAMQQEGLYLMYDMRSSYQNSTSITEQVNSIKSRPNLLLWYTADEPDGTFDPLSATVDSYNLINSLDGYHPISLVLYCQDFHFTEYTAGADIVMQDVYMIGNNVTVSNLWDTPCNTTYGCCGCDNCHGDFFDISERMDLIADRLNINGWDRTKAVWTVPQGFGNAEYWIRDPTGAEFLVETILGINHGALGSIAWVDPTPDAIKSSASTVAFALPVLTPYIASPQATFSHAIVIPPSPSPGMLGVDVGMWTIGENTLVLAANMDYVSAQVDLSALGLGMVVVQQEVMGGAGANTPVGKSTVSLGSVGSGAWVVTSQGLREGTSGGRRWTDFKGWGPMNSVVPILVSWIVWII